jgi:hypothetical protein
MEGLVNDKRARLTNANAVYTVIRKAPGINSVVFL